MQFLKEKRESCQWIKLRQWDVVLICMRGDPLSLLSHCLYLNFLLRALLGHCILTTDTGTGLSPKDMSTETFDLDCI